MTRLRGLPRFGLDALEYAGIWDEGVAESRRLRSALASCRAISIITKTRVSGPRQKLGIAYFFGHLQANRRLLICEPPEDDV